MDALPLTCGNINTQHIFRKQYFFYYTSQVKFFSVFIPQISQETALPADPAKDTNFKEDRVDKLRAQKDDELERYRRTVERTSNRHGSSYFDQSLK